MSRNGSETDSDADSESDVAEGCQWFSTECSLGPDGIVENLGIGEIDEYESKKLAEAIEELKLVVLLNTFA